MLLNEVEMGITPHATLDSFAIITLSQFLSIFSNFWGTIVLTIIPIYIAYKYGGYVLQFFCKREKT